jgi:hypothetical protein
LGNAALQGRQGLADDKSLLMACRSRKFHPAGIRAVKQNQGIISRDVRDALPAWDVLCQPVQAATPA